MPALGRRRSVSLATGDARSGLHREGRGRGRTGDLVHRRLGRIPSAARRAAFLHGRLGFPVILLFLASKVTRPV